MSAVIHLLVVSHETSRTGAVHSLLKLLEWFSDSGRFNLKTLCLRGGPHVDAFKSLGPTSLAKPQNLKQLETLAKDTHVVFVNSAASAGTLRPLSTLDIPIVVFVHELSHEISLLSQEDRVALTDVPDHYIACSKAVADNLQRQLSIPSDSISTLGELVDTDEIRQRALQCKESADIRSQLDLAPSTPLIGANGTPSWRKGVDLFLSTAAAVIDRHKTLRTSTPTPHFVWIGGGESPSDRTRIEYDINRMGLRGKITFTGMLDNPLPWMKALDIFCLPSREDPYPLVMIEAGILGIPIIGFAGSGGFDEFARDYGAFSVPPSTPGGMCDAIFSLLDSTSPDTSNTNADFQQLDISTMAPRFREIIEGLVSMTKTSEVKDARNAARDLVRSYYPVEIRVIADKNRLSSFEANCLVDDVTPVTINIPEGEYENLRVRLSFGDGPAEIQLSALQITGTDGQTLEDTKKPVITHSKEVADRGNEKFTVTGYHSRLYLPLPKEKMKTVTFQLQIIRVTLLSGS